MVGAAGMPPALRSRSVGLLYWSFLWLMRGGEWSVVGAMLASVLQALAKSVIVRSGDLHVVPIAEGLIIKPAGAAGHQNTIVVTPWQQDAVPAS
jgi:hypothetical protein